MSESTALETLVGMLPDIGISAIFVLDLEAHRRASDPIDTANRNVATETGYQVMEGQLAFRISATIDVPEFKLAAAVGVNFDVPNTTIFEENLELIDLFVQRVAFPAGYPYIRERIQTLSVSIGLTPVLLPLWRASDSDFTRVEDATVTASPPAT